MLKWLYVLWVLCGAGVAMAAEDLEFRAPAAADGAATAAAMRSLAVRALPVYQNPNRAQFLTNLSALQMVAGEYPAADATRRSFEEVRAGGKPVRRIDLALVYDMYVSARAESAKTHVPFDQAFARVFHETAASLSDRDAYVLAQWLTTPLSVFRENLQGGLDRLRSRDRISLAQAVDLAWTYLSFEAFQSFGPLVGPLIAQDDDRRYIIDPNVVVRTPDHVALSAVVIRPRSVSTPLPALLELAIAERPHNDAKESAAQGYAGVVAYARAADPYEHGGDDARSVIDWIADQKWSDGGVGMYGSGYGAFAAWSAAKHPPAALKALAAASAVVPGLDAMSPDRVPGMPGATYRRWLKHPSFDHYWQQIVPYGKDFARIAMPVLTITGYYDDRETGSLYYFTQHYRYNPHANDTLLIGPYDAQAMQRGPLSVLAGYAIDSAALIDLHDLRFRWFDHVLKGGPNPDLLMQHVNFEVMGANEWRHVESPRDMANRAARLYLDGKRVDGHYRLAGHEPPRKTFFEQRIALRHPAGSPPTLAIVGRTPAPGDAVMFLSGPLHRPLQLSGVVSGQLAFRANRDDLDIRIALYELLPSGEYFQLYAPPYALCASRPAEQNHRAVTFRSDRLTSVELVTGSRLVLSIGLDPAAPGHPGCAGRSAGRPASAHSTAALDVRWYAGSFIDIPVER
jgi:uncharacterized protein